MSIVTIRGTSGSGKTTLTREVMAWYGTRVPTFRPGRRQPLYYSLWRELQLGTPDLIVLGHYESVCGGCDTINSFDEVFDTLAEVVGLGLAKHVLFEGLTISTDTQRTIALHQLFPGQLKVLALTTPLDECVRSVNARRAERDPLALPVDPEGTASKHRTVARSVTTFREAGIHVVTADREQAKPVVRAWLLPLQPSYL